jgi:HSP20 family protein
MIMSIMKYDPFRELRSLQDDMNRLFMSNLSRGSDEGFMSGAWSPNVDIFENKDNLVVEVELPGMRREDVDVSIENNVLTLRGERKFEKKDEGDNYHRVERSYGSFTRSFTLPQTVTSEGAAADFSNGVLRIQLHKREETKARKIEISGESAKETKTIDTKAKSETANA